MTIVIKTWKGLNGTYFAMPYHRDYPNMHGVGLSAKIASFRVQQQIEKIKLKKLKDDNRN